MHVLAPNQMVEKFPYSIDELKKDHPQTSFPKNLSRDLLASYNVFPVMSVGVQHDTTTQVAELSGCAYSADKQIWETTWMIRDKTAEELQADSVARTAMVEAQRAEAYRTESDPLFFKAQRGEATQQQWLDKVSEIKARYPA